MRRLTSRIGGAALAVPLLSTSLLCQETVSGERVPASAISPIVRETMQQVAERERKMPKIVPPQRGWTGQDGRWIVPPPTAKTPAHSGRHAIVNEWGDARMDLGFPRLVDVDELWAAGHGSSAARAVRFVGYRGGEQVARSEWIPLGASHQRVELGFEAVDRLEVQTVPTVGRHGFVALDDLTFADAGRPQSRRVIDFDDLGYHVVVTGSGYAGLTWGTGRGFREPLQDTGVVPAPRMTRRDDGGDDSWSPPAGVAATAPSVWDNYIGASQGDPGANLVPPDTHGANGPDHYVSITNANLSAWTKSNQTRVVNTSLTAFWPNASGLVGDPRIVFDPDSERYVALATNFTGRIVYVAVSETDDPTGAWLKFSYNTAQGADAGRWPDFPTLGVDARGVYIGAFMVPSGMTIWAIEKAPMVANPPSVGTITAFRNLPFEGAIQHCTTYGDPGVAYSVSRQSSTQFRVRRVNPPLTAPTLTNVGSVTVPANSPAPNAPAMGSNTNINTVDARPMNAVFRNGSIYTVHNINVNGRAGCRWYEIDASNLNLVQSGTIADSLWHYYFATVAVDAADSVGLGFSGSHAGVFPSTFVASRLASDPTGTTSQPILTQAGQASWNVVDGAGRNRYGDYSHIDVDAVDDLGFWTNQEYIFQPNRWRTRVVRFGYEVSNYGTALAGTNGVPTIGTTDRPVIGAPITFEYGNSLGAATPGAMLIGSSKASQPLFGGTILVTPVPNGIASLSLQAGTTTKTYPFPNDSGLVGTSVFYQLVVLDSGAVQGLSLSDGLDVRASSR